MVYRCSDIGLALFGGIPICHEQLGCSADSLGDNAAKFRGLVAV